MEGAPSGGVYNVGGGCETSLREVIDLAEELSGASLEVVVEDEADSDVGRTSADTGRIRSTLGRVAATALESGPRGQLAWTALTYGQSVGQAVA
jgi:UDP-glucose 4-epimerase